MNDGLRFFVFFIESVQAYEGRYLRVEVAPVHEGRILGAGAQVVFDSLPLVALAGPDDSEEIVHGRGLLEAG